MSYFLLLALLIAFTATQAVAKGSSSSKSDSGRKGGSGGGSSAGANPITLGKPQCTNGESRCLHTWENEFINLYPQTGKGVCAEVQQYVFNEFFTLCQFESAQMMVDCGGPGTNTVSFTYSDLSTGKSSFTTSGSARALFSKTRPQSAHQLVSGTVFAPEPNMDIWVYCFDAPALLRPTAHGNFTLSGAPSCNVGANGQGGRCISFWHADYWQNHPIEGLAECLKTYPDPLPEAFVDVCSFKHTTAVHWPSFCEQRGINSLDITWDVNGNGKVVTTGSARALFASSPPALGDLLSGTVTSTAPNQNAYLYCPPLSK